MMAACLSVQVRDRQLDPNQFWNYQHILWKAPIALEPPPTQAKWRNPDEASFFFKDLTTWFFTNHFLELWTIVGWWGEAHSRSQNVEGFRSLYPAHKGAASTASLVQCLFNCRRTVAPIISCGRARETLTTSSPHIDMGPYQSLAAAATVSQHRAGSSCFCNHSLLPIRFGGKIWYYPPLSLR